MSNGESIRRSTNKENDIIIQEIDASLNARDVAAKLHTEMAALKSKSRLKWQIALIFPRADHQLYYRTKDQADAAQTLANSWTKLEDECEDARLPLCLLGASYSESSYQASYTPDEARDVLASLGYSLRQRVNE
ncbi:hypothetical protein ACEPPN_004042 [Leptodophora sp. 'Broadleaf-Isolate-01']